MNKIHRENLVRVLKSMSGFSIIEVLIFTLLSSMVLIGMSYATLISVKNSESSQNKTLSTRYIQQTQEWLKGQKEVDWGVFIGALDEGVYCINTLPVSIEDIGTRQGSCEDTDFALGGSFKRHLTITDINNDETEMTYTVRNYWRDGDNVVSAQVSGLFAEEN